MAYDEYHNIDSPIFHGGSNPHIPEFTPKNAEIVPEHKLVGVWDKVEKSGAESHMDKFRMPTEHPVLKGGMPRYRYDQYDSYDNNPIFEGHLEKPVTI